MNPLLAKLKLPGRVFQLPSKGVFYKNRGILAADVRDGEVQVKPMSALAETKMRTADLLLSGKIIKEICEECIPEILRPEDLVTQDIDAIFAFLRLVTHGPTLNVRTMHDCKGANQHDYEVNFESLLSNPGNSVLDHAELAYTAKLSNGQTVHLRPASYRDSMDVLSIRQELTRQHAREQPIDSKLAEKAAMLDLLAVIESVEDDGEVVDDREMIEEWARAITKPLLDEMMECLSRVGSWGYNLTSKVTCKDCGKDFDYQLDLDPVAFFFG